MEVKETLKKVVSKRNAELDELKARLDALEELNNNEQATEQELKAASEELDALKAKKEELEAELAELNAQIAELDKPADDQDQEQGRRNKLNFMKREERNTMTNEQLEQRAKAFATSGKMTVTNEETRAMLVSSGKIATPTGVKETINELNNEVSSIVDMVDIQDCEGMGSNKIPYEFTAATAGETSEGETYHEGDTVTDYVTTTPKTITVISQISKQVRKQSPVRYQDKVKKNSLNALRKKVSAYIVTKLSASKLCLKQTLTKFDEKTLRAVCLNYGGDENVEGNATLFLNKSSLVALGDVRGANEKKAVYEIIPNTSNPNTGVIKDGGLSVNYCINSNIAANTLIYGQALKFELDIYSDYEINVSEDFAFDKGMLTIRGDVELDGDVVFKDGFVIATVGGAA